MESEPGSQTNTLHVALVLCKVMWTLALEFVYCPGALLMHREYIYNTEEAVEYLPVSLSAGAFSHNNRGAAETTTRLAHTEPLFLPIAGFMF